MKNNLVKNFLSVVELRTKIISVSTLVIALFYVSWRIQFPPLVPLLLMWTATLAVDMGTTAFNNYFDYLRGTDHYRDVNEVDKVLIHSGVEPAFAFWSAFWCFAVAVVLGLILAFSGNLWVIPVGALCMAVGFFYTGGPFPISRTPFGELFAGGSLGFALFIIACGVWSVPFDSGVFFASLPSFFWIASILAVNNTCDIEGDRAAGRRTLSILLGVRGGETFVLFLIVAAQIAGLYAGFTGFLPRSVAFTLLAGSFPIALTSYVMHRNGYSHATKSVNMMNILKCFLMYTISMGLGFLASAVF